MNPFARRAVPAVILIITTFASAVAAEEAPPLPAFDFRQTAIVSQWRAAHDIQSVTATAEGMEVVASGDDPFLVGPPVALPEGAPLALEIRVRSERGGAVEVFYFADHARAGKSVGARVAAGVWETVRFPLPPMGPRMTFRIDPPATKGRKATIASMALVRRMLVPEPQWPKPVMPRLGGTKEPFTVRSGQVALVHDGVSPAGFEVRVNDRAMGVGLIRSQVGYVHEGAAVWVPTPDRTSVRAGPDGKGLLELTEFDDPQGGHWTIERAYSPGPGDGTIAIETKWTVSQDRELLFAPALVVLPGTAARGAGFGTPKTQALLSGLEYLGADDASSSEADVIGPASKRRVPDSLKLTLPLMAVCAEGRYLALAWDENPVVSALFDSPDRTFGGGGHVMGLLLPASDGRNRVEGSLVPEVPHTLRAGQPLTVRAVLMGGDGRSVVPAVKQYVAMHEMPQVPRPGMDAEGYSRFAGGGCLDSKIREGSLVRHAVWPGFGAQPAADAAVWMRWLAAQTKDAALAGRLDRTAKDVTAAVSPEQYDAAAVGHVRYPVESLVLGHVEENARRAAEHGHALLRRFEADGSIRFVRDPKKEDFARTNATPRSNGLTATHVARVLEAAAVSGDEELLRQGIKLLHGLDKFGGDVPRGAQSWEVPLHTPDVLASAMLLRAYLWGYELTGERRLLELAEYWAWTGVPFIYLRNPTDGQVGPYAAIAVYGATNWAEPVWFGRPVQWCGLVYADALYRLAGHQPTGPWKHLADGITACAIQQCWPASDPQRQGLLPDFYHLRAQTSDGPAINPATLQANAVRLFRGGKVYDFHGFPRHGLLVHAPGRIEPIEDGEAGVRFGVSGWPREPYWVLIAGARRPLQIRVNGAKPAPEVVQQDVTAGRIVLRLTGGSTVDLATDEKR